MTTDPKTWPVVECESADVFLGSFDHDCSAALSDEQRAWPVTDCEPVDATVPDKTPSPRQPSPSGP
jgi:hypothetical protein